MIAIAKKLSFTLEENPKSPTTLTVFAEREILESPKLNRLFGSAEGLQNPNSFNPTKG
jgi:hypothetical protein